MIMLSPLAAFLFFLAAIGVTLGKGSDRQHGRSIAATWARSLTSGFRLSKEFRRETASGRPFSTFALHGHRSPAELLAPRRRTGALATTAFRRPLRRTASTRPTRSR